MNKCVFICILILYAFFKLNINFHFSIILSLYFNSRRKLQTILWPRHLCCCVPWHQSTGHVCSVQYVWLCLNSVKFVCQPVAAAPPLILHRWHQRSTFSRWKRGGALRLSNALAAIWRVPLNCLWYFQTLPSCLGEAEPRVGGGVPIVLRCCRCHWADCTLTRSFLIATIVPVMHLNRM